MTLNERQESGLPEDLFLIGETGEGGYYDLDLSQAGEDGEAPVVEWIPGADNIRPLPVIAGNFGIHLRQMLGEFGV